MHKYLVHIVTSSAIIFQYWKLSLLISVMDLVVILPVLQSLPNRLSRNDRRWDESQQPSYSILILEMPSVLSTMLSEPIHNSVVSGALKKNKLYSRFYSVRGSTSANLNSFPQFVLKVIFVFGSLPVVLQPIYRKIRRSTSILYE